MKKLIAAIVVVAIALAIYLFQKQEIVVEAQAEKLKVGIQPEMLVPHEDDEVLVPIGFRDGIKSLFIVQDLSGELL